MQYSYDQPTKNEVRTRALTSAIEMLTSSRQQTAVVPQDHVRKVLAALYKSEAVDDPYIASRCRKQDIGSWESFRASHVGTRKASDLTVAYLAGPEPTNDLHVLVAKGVRPENIWAFENAKKTFALALGDIEKAGLRGVKLIDMSLDEYLEISPRKFDIIYLDACAPLPSEKQKTTRQLAGIFRHSALSPLGVLITNFAEPDLSDPAGEVRGRFARLVAAYLYPKPYLDIPELEGFGEMFSPYEAGFAIEPYPEAPEDATADDARKPEAASAATNGVAALHLVGSEESVAIDDKEEWISDGDYDDGESFLELVDRELTHFYGCFITRHIVDIASIIAPAARIFSNKLGSTLIGDAKLALQRADLLTTSTDYDEDLDWEKMSSAEREVAGLKGLALSEPFGDTLLFTLAYVGLLRQSADSKAEVGSTPDPGNQSFLDSWAQQLSGNKNDMALEALSAIRWFYGAKSDSTALSAKIRNLEKFTRESMPQLCDKTTESLGFYPAFAQLAHPAHCNFSKVKRFTYIAKSKRMYTDVIPFDECRYVHDWLSTPNLFTTDWADLSSQMIFRMALDAVAKSQHNYIHDFLYGCNVVGIDYNEFSPGELSPREDLSPNAPTPQC